MLTQIHINHLATIKELLIDFNEGTTVITGETGAGKSILINAIELALGERATPDLIREGEDKADISLCFDISNLSDAATWLKQNELDNNASDCIIRRLITKDGRSRSYINGKPITLQLLRELSELVMTIHSQHEHQTILKADVQRTILDRFAEHDEWVESVRNLAEDWHATFTELEELEKSLTIETQRKDFLKFQLNELNELNLIPNEFELLDLEHKQCAHSEELIQNMTRALNYLSESEEHNVLQLLHKAVSALETIHDVDPKIKCWIETLNTTALQLQDTDSELRQYVDTLNLDPERLQQIDQRLSKLFDMARKHKILPQELSAFQQKLQKDYTNLENSNERIIELRNKLISLQKEYKNTATLLSKSRIEAAQKLTQKIQIILQDLALPHCVFHIEVNQSESQKPHANGVDKVTFQIKTNVGQSLQPLNKIASGGELSRLALAIYLASAGNRIIPTLVFDEVDVGIGGGTAEIVGKLLRKLGKTHQVLCITHAPQVAALGHHHVRVEKIIKNNETYTSIYALSPSEKINEIARMMGGLNITHITRAHAQEMLDKTQV